MAAAESNFSWAKTGKYFCPFFLEIEFIFRTCHFPRKGRWQFFVIDAHPQRDEFRVISQANKGRKKQVEQLRQNGQKERLKQKCFPDYLLGVMSTQ